MKKKDKIIYLLIGLIIVLSIGLGSYYFLTRNNNSNNPNNSNNDIPRNNEEENTKKEEITPLLYEITKEGSNNKIYLFGSIHAANLKNVNFPKYVLNAYNDSHYIACEADIVAYQENTALVLSDTLKMLYSDNTTIKDHLSEETYNKLVNFLKEKKIYSSLYDNYQPFFFESLVSNALMEDAKLDATEGIDYYFLNKAKKDNKKILEVEGMTYQTDLLLSFKDELYELMLSELINDYDMEVESLKNLYEAWKKGNINDLLKYADDDIDVKNDYTKEQIELVNDYNQKVVKDRNISMTKKLIEYFNNNQDVFYMVGTLHLIGDDGIANLLTKEGFTVKQINNSVN